MKKEINLNNILQKWLHSYDMIVEFDQRGHDAIISAMKDSCSQVLNLAVENAYVEYIDLDTGEVFDYTDVITDDDVGANISKNSILQIKDWIK